jgi:hypothetical protein
MTGFAIWRGRGGGRRVAFGLYRVPRGGKARQPRRVRLAAWMRPGGNAEPVMTISQLDED